MIAAHNISTYKVSCAGGAPGVAARLDNAGQAGPLHLAPDHMLAAMLPDALDKTLAAPDVVLFITDLNGLILGGMLLGDDMLDKGVHWAWAYEPLAAFFQALDQTNMDKTPIKGHAAPGWCGNAPAKGTETLDCPHAKTSTLNA